jgi:hypothetical protein
MLFFYFISGYKNGGGKSSDFLICSIHPVDDEGLDVFLGGSELLGKRLYSFCREVVCILGLSNQTQLGDV